MGWAPVHQVQWPPLPAFASPPATEGATLLIDATGEKVAMMGRVWNKDRVTKNITRVGFRFATIVKAGGSGLTVSLQDVSLATSPLQPDEVQDQTVAIANGDAGFASTVWYRTGAFNAVRTVAFGELLAVVIEYDGGGRLGADSVIIGAITTAATSLRNNIGSAGLKTGGTWAGQNLIQNVALEFDDGTFGTLFDSYPALSANTTAFNTGSAADEFALEFTVPAPMKVDGAWAELLLAASASVDLVLYDGTTALVTVSTDFHAIATSGSTRLLRVPFAEQTLVPGTTYRLSVKPTTANNVTIYDFTMSDANHLQAWPLGTSAYLATRVDAGAWTPLTTRRPLIGLYLSAVSDGLVIPPTYNLGI